MSDRLFGRTALIGGGHIGLLLALLFLWVVPGHADTLHVTDDTYIKLNALDLNNGTHKELRVSKDGIIEEHRTFINFDLSVLPAGIDGSNIDKATLRLWVRKVESEGTIAFHQILAGWSEDTLSSANEPGINASFDTRLVTFADAQTYITVDVTL